MNSYYITHLEGSTEHRVMYAAPCGVTQHIATVIDLGTRDERIDMHVNPVVPNTLRKILELIEAQK